MIDNSKVTIANADIKKLEKRFATKNEFKSLVIEIQNMKDEFITRFNQIDKKHEEFITRFDEIMGELKASREEQVIQSYHISGNRDKLDNQETRITLIEDKIAF